MSATKRHLDAIVTHSLATGEPIPDDVADALDDILDVAGLDAEEILDIYGEQDHWALALARHRRAREADRAARRAARGLGLLILAALSTACLILAYVAAALWPGTIVCAVAFVLSAAMLGAFIYALIGADR